MKQSILHRSLATVLLTLMAFCTHASFKYVDTDTGLKFEMHTGLSGGSDAARRAMLVGFSGKSGDVAIPENVVYSHLDWKVVAIRSAQEGGNVTSVVIPDTVRRMDDDAFASCSELTEVVIGTGLTKIPKGAFRSCVFQVRMEPDGWFCRMGCDQSAARRSCIAAG